MADNFTANPGAGGDTFAADDVSGVKYPVSKIDVGGDGASLPLSNANPMPVSLRNVNGTVPVTGTFWQTTQPVSAATLPLPTGAAADSSLASILAKMPALLTTAPAAEVSAPPVRPVGQDLWTCSFAGVGASLVTADMTQRALGTGVGVSQSGGNLLVTTGTNTNAEFLARSNVAFRGALIARYKTILSQRIAQNNFAFMLADKIGEGLSCLINSATSISVTLTAHGFTAQSVGQFINVGAISGAAGVPGRYAISSIPDANTINFTVAGWPASGSCTVDLFGWNYIRNLYNGATATNSFFDTQRKGWANGNTTATINTTASPGHLVQIKNDGRNVYLSDELVASSATPNSTTRASKVENLPDDDVDLYVYLWSFNGTSAPASTTTWTVGFWAVEDFTNFPVFIAGQKHQGTEAPGPVQVVGTPAVTISSGTVTTVSTVTTCNTVTNGNVGFPGIIADVASAALTTTTTTAAFTPTYGCSYEVNIPVTAVSGTTPTLDVVVQESDDSGTNWFDVYHFPRITATGMYRSPKLPLTGNRVRYVQTVGGTTPSFTRAVNRLQESDSVAQLRQLIDRAISVTTLNATTSGLNVQNCRNAQVVFNIGTASTPPAVQLEGSDDNGATWYSIGSPLTAVASSTVQLTVNNIQTGLLRGRISTAGVTVVAGYLLIKAF